MNINDENCGCPDCIRDILDELDHWADYQDGLIASPS